MATNYSNGLIKDYQRLMLAFEESLSENRKLKAEICELKNEVKELKEINVKKDEKINELTLEIKRLKNNKSKDSSNSSKPSSKNNYKKVKNSREKTWKKQGGQQNHKVPRQLNSDQNGQNNFKQVA